MSASTWQLDHHRAQLRRGSLSATLDLSAPNRGLFDIRGGPPQLETAEILALRVPACHFVGGNLPQDAFVRGSELVAEYSDGTAWPIAVNARWICGSDSDPGLTAVWDLIVSVHTEQLDSRPALAVVSAVACCQTLRLMERESGRFSALPAALATQPFAPASGEGCILLRLPNSLFSYVEMVHPLDFHCGEVCLEGEGAACRATVVNHLFPETLEKGVVLRARVRAVLLPCEDDCRLAADAYRKFAAAAPPLGA
ncbi:MAG: hypothetical protein GXY83_00375 [Rhodopirellula sp.]|nr:hypothetical protein [Rhodopirellula sp.]